MDNSTIIAFLDRIGKPKSINCISLEDYPESNQVSQTIAERVNDIKLSLGEFNGFIKNDSLNNLIKSVWSIKVLDKNSFINEIDNLELINSIETSNGSITTVSELKDESKVPKDELKKKEIEVLRDKLEDLNNTINDAFVLFNNTWQIIKSAECVKFDEDNPSIKQIFSWTALLPQTSYLNPGEDVHIPYWDCLCNKINSLCNTKTDEFYRWYVIIPTLAIFLLGLLGYWTLSNRENVLAISISQNAKWIHYIFIIVYFIAILSVYVLVLYKLIQYKTKQCETNAKIKEKAINTVVDAFHEDREYSRLRTKTEIALHEKLEKARIEEWCRNKEHERKLNIMEQERIAELSDVLKELAKTMNKTIVDNQDKGKTITVERSILCEDCCNEIKEMVNATIA